MRRLLLILIALAATLAAVTAWLLPPVALPASDAAWVPGWPVVRGAYHVHSSRSDGTGSIDEIAAAAALAGLQFVIVTDHGDGTREPAAPSYRSGVLVLDGVEISTSGGHYVALDMRRAPYPLAGSPEEVIEDVRRLGGFGIAAHPGSPKAELAWEAWDAPFDGMEWLNADSEWRDELLGSLGRVLLTYAFRPTETLAGLLDRPVDVLAQWDRLSATRQIVGLAAADAHARLGLGSARDPYDDRVVARLPPYEVSFAAFQNHVVLDGPFSGDAEADASQLLDAIRAGRVYASIDGLARAGAFEAKATTVGGVFARIGEVIDPAVGPVAIDARVAAPPGTTLVVLKNGLPIYDAPAPSLRIDIGHDRGAYRVEARLPSSVVRSTVPWIVTNPIYVGLPASPPTAAPAAVVERSGLATAAWVAEASAGSTSRLDRATLADGTPAVRWTYQLAGGARHEQYAAVRFPLDASLRRHTRLQLRALSEAPRRVWAQLRSSDDGSGDRWGSTFYLDGELRSIDLPFAAFRALGGASAGAPDLTRIDTLLLVVDTLNNQPGSSGTVLMPDLWLVR